jgi:stage V sporulation protein G
LSLEITNVKIYPFDTSTTGGKVKAMAEVEIGHGLLIKGLKIVESRNGGIFVGYPSRRGKDGVYREIVQPVSRDAEAAIRQAVVEAYKEALKKVEKSP